MKGATCHSACGWLAGLLAGAALAAQPALDLAAARFSGGFEAEARSGSVALTQRLRLAKQQLTQSASVQRILQNDHADAKAKLVLAQALCEEAELELGAGNFAAARHLVDESLRLMVLAAKLARETVGLSDRHVQHSRELRMAAQQQVNRGDYPAALKSIQAASVQLENSLRLAGVVVPQSQDITR